jgi:aryl-alcohol dehydrogenase-like predicted oxidoreductase
VDSRPIPKTGELLPVVGLGTWQAFDVGASDPERAPLREVVRRFLAAGARVVDSSPMYGRAEEVAGDVLATLPPGTPSPFLATKVWTRGRERGIEEMRRSMKRMRTARIDLMQVHNLLDWQTHLPVLREWKAEGIVRYIGITHYAHSAFDEMERLLVSESLDFVQLPYSVVDRAAEKRLLPAAKDTATAVLVMRPFDEGAVFRRLARRPLPSWAGAMGAASWAEVLLKFILGHPAVTCPIPATADPEHLAANVAAGSGPLPDETLRRKIVAEVEAAS